MHEMKREIYTVKITDSYKKIAHAHHITVAQLKGPITSRTTCSTRPEADSYPSRRRRSPGQMPHRNRHASRAVLSDTSSMASLSASPTPGAEHHHHYYNRHEGRHTELHCQGNSTSQSRRSRKRTT